ncbi:MAG: aminoacetone oxidase family FAD-binding enzyme [Oscillospiraceae bacterium]|jgi:predicted Rossmann fold flavoprotein|nr:aminoacetone oxidase family FAD-binding enzyme [Oscillospiraceae bacterium]
MSENVDVLIVGGGASGLMAAIASAGVQGVSRVVLAEKMPRVGKKLLATGNGRCNFTNVNADDMSFYKSGRPETVARVLARFTRGDTERFFNSVGVSARTEDGRLYPYSLLAGAVVDALRFEAGRLGVKTVTDTPVTVVEYGGGRYRAAGFAAKSLVVATGGMASPSLGSDGSGYAILTGFGHAKTAVFPALTQLVTEKAAIRGLSGIRVTAKAALYTGGVLAADGTDELLFTDYGLSGPLALSLSREASAYLNALPEAENCGVTLDLFPEMDKEELLAKLLDRRRNHAEWAAEELFLGLAHKRVGLAVMRAAGIAHTGLCGGFAQEDILSAAEFAKAYPITVTGTRGFADAQVTCGGIALDDFAPDTLSSRLSPGLFACGEVLDADGQCGGFNLQWAWSSGYAAGRGAGLFAARADARIDRQRL